jgi:hypothetical protein
MRTDLKLARVNRERFQWLVQQTPYFSLHVMQLLVNDLRRMTRMGVKNL